MIRKTLNKKYINTPLKTVRFSWPLIEPWSARKNTSSAYHWCHIGECCQQQYSQWLRSCRVIYIIFCLFLCFFPHSKKNLKVPCCLVFSEFKTSFINLWRRNPEQNSARRRNCLIVWLFVFLVRLKPLTFFSYLSCSVRGTIVKDLSRLLSVPLPQCPTGILTV